MATQLDRVVEFVRAHPDCGVRDIENATGSSWELLCRVDQPGFPIVSTAGGSAERGHTWKFRVR